MLIGTEAFRRWTAREFPDAPMRDGDIGETISFCRASLAARKRSS